ncbi:hypothetical protein NDU88_006817 [Pleurodeles waltl]|uniref:Uncharacterized protein n=1 Tax=Pleurodeles waltl TaxID=8319 RepID=A0AAV7QQ28_PLEWA|nr:hypothetical protein NDU88_006817 [Pleurodeles waltl]
MCLPAAESAGIRSALQRGEAPGRRLRHWERAALELRRTKTLKTLATRLSCSQRLSRSHQLHDSLKQPKTHPSIKDIDSVQAVHMDQAQAQGVLVE